MGTWGTESGVFFYQLYLTFVMAVRTHREIDDWFTKTISIAEILLLLICSSGPSLFLTNLTQHASVFN